MAIESRAVDPRDVTEEVDNPTYRAYFWKDSSCREFELVGGDVLEMSQWAGHERREGERFDLHAVVRRPDAVVLLRLMSS